jgi:hypothetical protein
MWHPSRVGLAVVDHINLARNLLALRTHSGPLTVRRAQRRIHIRTLTPNDAARKNQQQTRIHVHTILMTPVSSTRNSVRVNAKHQMEKMCFQYERWHTPRGKLGAKQTALRGLTAKDMLTATKVHHPQFSPLQAAMGGLSAISTFPTKTQQPTLNIHQRSSKMKLFQAC